MVGLGSGLGLQLDKGRVTNRRPFQMLSAMCSSSLSMHSRRARDSIGLGLRLGLELELGLRLLVWLMATVLVGQCVQCKFQLSCSQLRSKLG